MRTSTVETVTGDQALQKVVVVIIVNKRPVVVFHHDRTGLQIKEAAIREGVPIELSFSLIEKRPGQPSLSIGDTDVVHLHEGQHFTCLPSDDNS